MKVDLKSEEQKAAYFVVSSKSFMEFVYFYLATLGDSVEFFLKK
jgi:hypothetical protein